MLATLFDKDREVTQLHWGGGTPTFLTTEQSDRLMSILSSRWNLSSSDSRDFSIEIDPRSVDAEGINHLVSQGFNRSPILLRASFFEEIQSSFMGSMTVNALFN